MEEKKPDFSQKTQMVGLAFELGYIIALPLLVFALLGKWLDQRYQSSPWFKIAGLLLAIALSSIWLYRRFRDMFQQMKKK